MCEFIKNNSEIKIISEKIADLAGNCKIILFSYKLTVTGDLSSYKLCVISHTTSKITLEKQIYLLIDSPLPYDVVVYTFDEWQELLNIKNSFAAKIDRTGCVLYEKKI